MRACLIKHKVTTAQAAQAHKVLYKPRTKQEGTGVEQAPASLVRTEPPSFRSTEQNAITKVNSSSNLVPRLLTDWEVGRSLFFKGALLEAYHNTTQMTKNSLISSPQDGTLWVSISQNHALHHSTKR